MNLPSSPVKRGFLVATCLVAIVLIWLSIGEPDVLKDSARKGVSTSHVHNATKGPAVVESVHKNPAVVESAHRNVTSSKKSKTPATRKPIKLDTAVRKIALDIARRLKKESKGGKTEQAHENSNSKPLLVIFTTFRNTSDKLFIYNNTINNWSALKPRLKPVLFTTPNQGVIKDVAKKAGWDTIPCPRFNTYGTPYLKDMYFEVMNRYNASFYGYCNGDILFDVGMLDTLESVRDYMLMGKFNSSIIVSRRWNHELKNESFYANAPIWYPSNVRTLARDSVSTLFRTDAEDFFFVNRNYPWDGIKDVVIGRPGYDNYIFARSINMSVASIDASYTVACVHQTSKDGNFAGFQNDDRSFNWDLIGKFKYYEGHTDQAWFETRRDFIGRIFLIPNKWKKEE